MTANKQVICDLLLEWAERDTDIVVLSSDARGSASMTAFAERYPDRYVETGIAEQNITGIAAGLALSGKKAVVASPACFLSARAFEQIKVDVCYSAAPVCLLGVSGGVSYGALGMTHYSLQDIAATAALPGLVVELPADNFSARSAMERYLTHPAPTYLRVGRSAVEDVPVEDTVRRGWAHGKATLLAQGTDAALLVCGEPTATALAAARLVAEEGIRCRVLELHTLKPLDTEAVLRAARETGRILTVEEHSAFGGLGAMVAQTTARECPVPVHSLAIGDEPPAAGTQREIWARYGISVKGIAAKLRAMATA